MKLEDQLCTLEQAKLLKSLGVSQHSIYYLNGRGDEPIEAWIVEGDAEKFFSAYTVAELGVMNRDNIRAYKTDGFWCAYIPTDEGMRMHTRFFKTEAELRADILITDIEYNKNYIDEVNQRLLSK